MGLGISSWLGGQGRGESRQLRIRSAWAEAAPGPEQAPERVGPERVGPERAGPDKPAIAAAGLPVPLVQADPGNVRLMLQMVRDRWLMVRPDNGQDYLYFSTVLPYRQARYDLADGALPYWRAGA